MLSELPVASSYEISTTAPAYPGRIKSHPFSVNTSAPVSGDSAHCLSTGTTTPGIIPSPGLPGCCLSRKAGVKGCMTPCAGVPAVVCISVLSETSTSKSFLAAPTQIARVRLAERQGWKVSMYSTIVHYRGGPHMRSLISIDFPAPEMEPESAQVVSAVSVP